MKQFVLIIFTFLSTYASAQQLTEIQARRGAFTERLFLKDRWIDGISTDLNSIDSLNDNLLVTARAVNALVRSKNGNPVLNQNSTAQPGGLWLRGKAIIGSFANYQPQLADGLPAQFYITQSGSGHGLSIQRASLDVGPATMVFFKNRSTAFNNLQAVQPWDSLGSIVFSGVAGNNSTIVNAMSIHGRVEKTGPTYLTSGFVFNTTDSAGTYAQRMWLNGAGQLLLGSDNTNAYRLNVAGGDVRINSLSASGNVLMGADNNGVLTKIRLSEEVALEDGTLSVGPASAKNFRKYVATIRQSSLTLQAPAAWVLEGTVGKIQWARIAPGVYTGTLEGAFPRGATWFKTEASDDTGAAEFVKLTRMAQDVIMLTVQDGAGNFIDNWSNISVEIRTLRID